MMKKLRSQRMTKRNESVQIAYKQLIDYAYDCTTGETPTSRIRELRRDLLFSVCNRAQKRNRRITGFAAVRPNGDLEVTLCTTKGVFDVVAVEDPELSDAYVTAYLDPPFQRSPATLVFIGDRGPELRLS